MRLARALALVVLGVAVGGLAVLTHRTPVGMALGLVASAATAVALPGGWTTRFAFTAGWVAALAGTLVPRSGGGFLIASDVRGYVLLAFGLVLMLTGIVTVRPLRAPPPDDGEADSGSGSAPPAP